MMMVVVSIYSDPRIITMELFTDHWDVTQMRCSMGNHEAVTPVRSDDRTVKAWGQSRYKIRNLTDPGGSATLEASSGVCQHRCGAEGPAVHLNGSDVSVFLLFSWPSKQ